MSDEIMKSTWNSEQDSVSTAIESSNLWLIQDPQTGAWKLHVDGAWGYQGEWIEVGWELIYQDGQWVLDDCAVE